MRGLPVTVPEDLVTDTMQQIITYRDWEQGVILASIQEAMDLLEKNEQRVM